MRVWLGASLVLGLAALLVVRCASQARTGAGREVEPDRAQASPGAQAQLAAADALVPGGAEGVVPAPTSPPVRAEEPERPSAEARERDPVQCVLHGRVRAEGASLRVGEAASVFLTRGEETRGGQAQSDGSYSIAGVGPGRWELQVQRPGYRSFTSALELTLDEPIVRRDFALVPSWLLRVRLVTSAGEPYLEALARSHPGGHRALTPLVVATREAPPPTIPAARAALDNGYLADGIYHTWDDLAGAAGEPVLEVLVEPPVHVSVVLGETVLGTQRVEAGAEAVTFVLDPQTTAALSATVKVRLVSSVDREPVQLAEIHVGDALHMIRGAEWSHTFLPGEQRFTFRAHGFATQRRTLTLAPGEVLDLGELELEPELTIRGRLLDAQGRPVQGALALGQRDSAGRLRFQDDYRYECDATGRFEIRGLARAHYVLRSEPEPVPAIPTDAEPPERWVLANTPVSTLGGSVAELELACVRAGFLVLRNADALAPDTRCKVLDANGELLAHDGFFRGHVPRFALPGGPCTLVLCDEQWSELRRLPVVIGAGVLELDLGR